VQANARSRIYTNILVKIHCFLMVQCRMKFVEKKSAEETRFCNIYLIFAFSFKTILLLNKTFSAAASIVRACAIFTCLGGARASFSSFFNRIHKQNNANRFQMFRCIQMI